MQFNPVLNFINRFTARGRREEVIDTFSFGCCYWFAFILANRFGILTTTIMYDPAQNHFATKVGDRIYDITGDVTEQYDWKPWSDIQKSSRTEYYGIVRDCIEF